jgi:cytochrome c oxidase subunit 3
MSMSYSPSVQSISDEHDEDRPISNGVLGMLLFVITEIMFFAGMISAFSIVRASSAIWPPPDQPRLPFEATAFNSVALLASGALLIWTQRRFAEDRNSARLTLIASIALGSFFVVFQGFEWVSMIAQGLTLTSSSLGSFFYLIVGMHGIHAIVAIGFLLRIWLRLERGQLQPSQLATAGVFWYFVVGAWPIIYWQVYL